MFLTEHGWFGDVLIAPEITDELVPEISNLAP
jgi:hypothetical protein